MGRKTAVIFCVFVLCAVGLLGRILYIAVSPEYIEVAQRQSSTTLTVSRTRGRIYDCKMRTLAGGRAEYRAVVTPLADNAANLIARLDKGLVGDLEERLKSGRPFVLTVPDGSIESDGITVYKTCARYGSYTPAAHVVGHLNGEGAGVMGIERAYDRLLESFSGELEVSYRVNAGGERLEGAKPVISDTTANSEGGVVLTIDTDVQLIAEEAARKYLECGAIVVLEAGSGKVRAMVSAPSFSPKNVAASLEDENSPLVNRALASYDVGSVFKLVVAAAALEDGFSEDYQCECSSRVKIGKNSFSCSDNKKHGNIDMQEALARSCNVYFINLSSQLGGAKIRTMAQRLGFGESIRLGEGYLSSGGRLPDPEELARPAGLANFSFGQGSLQADAVQIAGMINCIASGGSYTEPVIVERAVNSRLETISSPIERRSTQVISKENAEKLTFFMTDAVKTGTARKGAPEKVSAAAKTGTAETGMLKNGKQVIQAWYAGFFPAWCPKYVCVVLAENGDSGGATAGPVFKFIADALS